MKIKKSVKFFIIGLLTALLLCVGFLGAVWAKIIKLNHPKGLKGADVSSYQGETDWAVLSKEMDFVFIKATEGSSYTDEMFPHNFAGARAEGLYTGAYHFFSFDSAGATQAENFISAIDGSGLTDGMLPPVIDVELYGEYMKHPKPAEEVIPEIEAMVSALEERYGKKPMIYCTGRAYRLYSEGFEGCLLWRRNVYFRPLGSDWTFWQYTDTEQLEGYHGDEKYIDMNVFCGSETELAALCIEDDSKP